MGMIGMIIFDICLCRRGSNTINDARMNNSLNSYCPLLGHSGILERIIRVIPSMGHTGHEGSRRQSQFHPIDLTSGVFYQNVFQQLFHTLHRQLFARQLGLSDALEKALNIKLIEKKASPVQLRRASTLQVISDLEVLIHSAMVATIGMDIKLATPSHFQSLLGLHVMPRHLNEVGICCR
jgi:hypothetical protein